MNDLAPRLRAVCDLDIAEVREYCGRHEYDGLIQDLSPDGVRKGLARLAEAAGAGEALDDAHDEAHLAAFENRTRVEFGELELYRGYAPAEERDRAREAQLAAWPQAVDAAVTALDRVSAPVAQALAAGIAGLSAGIPASAPAGIAEAARAAHARLAAHIEQAAATGDPGPALGGPALAALMSSAERIEVDLGGLAEQADAERDRLAARLAESCAQIDPGRPALTVARELVRDHPGPEGVLDAARHWTQQAIAFTKAHDLVPYHDGECLVGLAPESRRWAMAMMSPAAPGEPEGPSWYHIT